VSTAHYLLQAAVATAAIAVAAAPARHRRVYDLATLAVLAAAAGVDLLTGDHRVTPFCIATQLLTVLAYGTHHRPGWRRMKRPDLAAQLVTYAVGYLLAAATAELISTTVMITVIVAVTLLLAVPYAVWTIREGSRLKRQVEQSLAELRRDYPDL
jgi:hypothetical protein